MDGIMLSFPPESPQLSVMVALSLSASPSRRLLSIPPLCNHLSYFCLLRRYSKLLRKVIAAYVKKGSGKPVAAHMSKDQQQAVKGDAQGICKPEVDLPEAEPSGYLHIGHAKVALLSKYFAEHYQAEVIMHFDDTKPVKESNEFVDNLVKDYGTLGLSLKLTWLPDTNE